MTGEARGSVGERGREWSVTVTGDGLFVCTLAMVFGVFVFVKNGMFEFPDFHGSPGRIFVESFTIQAFGIAVFFLRFGEIFSTSNLFFR